MLPHSRFKAIGTVSHPQGLNGAFEADGAAKKVVRRRGLSDEAANEIVGQNVCPDFLPNQLGGLASQVIHLHG
jgi:hypothetical protein